MQSRDLATSVSRDINGTEVEPVLGVHNSTLVIYQEERSSSKDTVGVLRQVPGGCSFCLLRMPYGAAPSTRELDTRPLASAPSAELKVLRAQLKHERASIAYASKHSLAHSPFSLVHLPPVLSSHRQPRFLQALSAKRSEALASSLI